MVVFFFKQKTAYEMRISDWSSDVCSSDRARSSMSDKQEPEKKGKGKGKPAAEKKAQGKPAAERQASERPSGPRQPPRLKTLYEERLRAELMETFGYKKDRKSVVEGKSVSVRVGIGGRRVIQKTTKI